METTIGLASSSSGGCLRPKSSRAVILNSRPAGYTPAVRHQGSGTASCRQIRLRNFCAPAGRVVSFFFSQLSYSSQPASQSAATFSWSSASSFMRFTRSTVMYFIRFLLAFIAALVTFENQRDHMIPTLFHKLGVNVPAADTLLGVAQPAFPAPPITDLVFGLPYQNCSSHISILRPLIGHTPVCISKTLSYSIREPFS